MTEDEYDDEDYGPTLSVDAGLLLIVDPCYLPPEVVRAVTITKKLGQVVEVPGGDMPVQVVANPQGPLELWSGAEPTGSPEEEDSTFVRPWEIYPTDQLDDLLTHWSRFQ